MINKCLFILKSRYIYFLFFMFILISSFLFWLFVGRSNTIILAAENFYVQSFSCTDTIHISLKINEDWSMRSYSEFSEKGKNTFLKIMNAKSKQLKFIDENAGTVDKYLFSIYDTVPFYCRMENASIVGTNSLIYECHFVWFFGWHQIYGPYGPPYKEIFVPNDDI